ncbi:DMT family transporter [Neptunomonas japonica]|uniref:DMT superfamily exporter inner membrane protein n=1 Tax=Neptunomonas japonica JAMM 1380 TaxID=1441457 RepID=A0A7R6SXP5_9GAMM|nr:DMT family transporter [Neptunomonas japonica]BBB30857.1 DMT superfamily exporter inner membrane protein [Neptunomonas japonica JAMM 1380]
MSAQHKPMLLAMILLGMSLIPVGDSAGKLLTEMDVSPVFVAWSRLLVGFLFILPFSGLVRSEIKQLYNWRMLLRAGLFTSAIFCMISALKTEPIANVFGIFFIGPIVAYFLAAAVLKERITLLRSVLLFIGFAGVLLVVKPGVGITSGMLFALVAGVCYGCMLVANRWLAGFFRPRLILLSTLLAGSIALTPAGIESIPQTIDSRIIWLVLVSSIASALGNLIIIEANRRLDANIVAPFVYSQLVAAAILGVFLFNEWPDAYSLIGLAIIFTSGILSFVLSNRKTKIALK